MTKPTHVIERLILPMGDSDLRALAQLLVDAVESGAAVSFLAPLTLERAEDWWRRVISSSHSGAIFLVARDVEGIVGTVQLHPAWAPNQPQRAEIAKLLVHRRSRRTGLGAQLMQTIEDAARRAGFSLLTLDTKRGDAAERLYRHIGWTPAGTIPGYALDPDGTPHDAVIFYKELNQADEHRSRLNGGVGRTRSNPMRTDDSYDARVAQILAELGIPASYVVDRHLPSHAETKELVSVGMDIYGRDRQLTPYAAGRWTELRAAALQDGIALLLVSAFRSLEYQRHIFERKISAGESLERILKVNTPPGYSEHHTGRAVDLTTPGCAPLAEEFETTAAFAWLARHAHRFGFAMTYPRENQFGITYEPWHWAVQG